MSPDFAITINALGMVACIVGTLAALFFAPKRMPRVGSIILVPTITFFTLIGRSTSRGGAAMEWVRRPPVAPRLSQTVDIDGLAVIAGLFDDVVDRLESG